MPGEKASLDAVNDWMAAVMEDPDGIFAEEGIDFSGGGDESAAQATLADSRRDSTNEEETGDAGDAADQIVSRGESDADQRAEEGVDGAAAGTAAATDEDAGEASDEASAGADGDTEEDAAGDGKDDAAGELSEAELAALGERARNRIQGLVREVKAREEKLAELEAKVAELSAQSGLFAAPKAAPAGWRPPQAERIAQLEKIVELARKHPDGYGDPSADNYLDADQVQAAREEAERELVTLRAEAAAAQTLHQAQFAAAVQADLSQAVQQFPFLKDPKKPEYQLAERIVQQLPELRERFANWPTVLGILADGLSRLHRGGGAERKSGAATSEPEPSRAAAGEEKGRSKSAPERRAAPSAPRVGLVSASGSGAPRRPVAAGRRANGRSGRGVNLAEAAAKGDDEALVAGLEALL